MIPSLTEFLRWWTSCGNPNDWHPWVLQPWEWRRRGIDGKPLSSIYVMRRRHAGAWQYRDMSDDEEREDGRRHAW